MGVPRETLRDWEHGSNGESANPSTPDLRVSVPRPERKVVTRADHNIWGAVYLRNPGAAERRNHNIWYPGFGTEAGTSRQVNRSFGIGSHNILCKPDGRVNSRSIPPPAPHGLNFCILAFPVSATYTFPALSNATSPLKNAFSPMRSSKRNSPGPVPFVPNFVRYHPFIKILGLETTFALRRG